jgi:hypothetical protein
MKKMILICSAVLVNAFAHGQTNRDAQIKPADVPVNNPNQVPNYYQNNSSYSNNSAQNNKPSTGNVNTYPGNGNYVDPTRSPSGANYSGSNNQLPPAGPLNSVNPSGTNAGVGGTAR